MSNTGPQAKIQTETAEPRHSYNHHQDTGYIPQGFKDMLSQLTKKMPGNMQSDSKNSIRRTSLLCMLSLMTVTPWRRIGNHVVNQKCLSVSICHWKHAPSHGNPSGDRRCNQKPQSAWAHCCNETVGFPFKVCKVHILPVHQIQISSKNTASDSLCFVIPSPCFLLFPPLFLIPCLHC